MTRGRTNETTDERTNEIKTNTYRHNEITTYITKQIKT